MSCPTTNWALFEDLKDADDVRRWTAFGELAESYGPPLFAFARITRWSVALSREDCQDLVSNFFLRCIEQRSTGGRSVLERADPALGRFRSYLLKSFTYFVLNEIRNGLAGKRAPAGAPPISLDALLEKHGARFEPLAHESPEDAYNRVLRVSLFEQTVEEFNHACKAAGQEKKFLVFFRHAIAPDRNGTATPSYADLAGECGLPSVDAVGRVVRGAQSEFRELLRRRVAKDAESPAEADIELERVLAAVSGAPVG
jgi:hypothetical protein